MLVDLALAGIERAANRSLSLDPASQKRLHALDGSVFHVRCTAPELDLYLIIQADQVRLAQRWGAPADCQLQGPGSAFAGLIQAEDPASYLINSPLQLRGDSERLLRLQQILKDLDPDWEGPLATLFGDVLGHQLGRGLRRVHAGTREGMSRLHEQTQEFLREESGWFPHPEDLRQFNQELDALAADTERLQARWRQFLKDRQSP